MASRRILPSLVLLGLLYAPPTTAAVWSERELIGIENAYDDYEPEVAIDPQGRAWIVWMGVENLTSGYDILWRRWEEGTGWSPRQTVHPPNVNYDSWVRLSMAPDGTPWVVWLRRRPTGYYWDLLSSRWNGSGWTAPDTLVASPLISDANYYALAAVDSLHCWAVYDLSNEVKAKYYDGVRWGPAESVISGTEVDPFQVDAALGTDGQPWAIWDQEGVRASRRMANGSWEPSVLIYMTPWGPTGVHRPMITVDAAGEAWAAWVDFVECPPSDPPDVFWAKTIGKIWQSPAIVNRVLTSNCALDGAPDIASSYGWAPRAVWCRKFPDDGHTPATYYDPYSSSWDSQGWSPECMAQQSEPALLEDSYPRIAVGPGGEAWVTWTRKSGTSYRYDIYASRLLCDVVELAAARDAEGVQISWRVVGYSPRTDFLFRVMRACAGAETTQVGELVPGSTDEYLVVDETAAPGLRYSYWVEVLDATEGIDPPTGTLLFLTNSRTVEPLVVSAGERGWRNGVPFTASPNPSAEAVAFRFAGAARGCVVEVFDVQGRLVWTHEAPASGAAGWRIVRWRPYEGGSNASGVFWARLRSKDGRTLGSTKVVVLH